MEKKEFYFFFFFFSLEKYCITKIFHHPELLRPSKKDTFSSLISNQKEIRYIQTLYRTRGIHNIILL